VVRSFGRQADLGGRVVRIERGNKRLNGTECSSRGCETPHRRGRRRRSGAAGGAGAPAD